MTTRRRATSGFTVLDRRTLFLMCMVGLVAGYGAATISNTLPFARESLGLSQGGMFWILAVTRLMSLAGILFAVFADREGRRSPFLVAFALIPVGNLITGMMVNPVTFTIGQSLTRIGVVAVAALAVVILAEDLSPERRGRGLGIYALAGSAGAGFGLIILPFAETGSDRWRILFGLTAIGLLALPVLDRFLRETRAFVRPTQRVTYGEIVESGTSRYLWILAAMAFLVAAFSSPTFTFIFERLIDELDWTTRSATWLLILSSGLGTSGVLVGGRLADTIGRRTTTVAALGIGAVGGVAFYFVTTGWLLGLAAFLGTFGAAMLSPAFAAHRSELFPTRFRATAAGVVTNVAIVGSLLGFLVGAFLVDDIGLSRTVAVLGLGLAAAAYLVLQLPETVGKDLVGFAVETGPVPVPGDAGPGGPGTGDPVPAAAGVVRSRRSRRRQERFPDDAEPVPAVPIGRHGGMPDDLFAVDDDGEEAPIDDHLPGEQGAEYDPAAFAPGVDVDIDSDINTDQGGDDDPVGSGQTR